MKRLLIILFFLPVMLFAQTEQDLLPSEKKELTIITEPYTLYEGFFRVGFSLQYGALYKIYDEDGDKVPISNSSGRSWTSQLMGQYGISDRLQATIGIPYTNQELFLSYRGEAPGINTFTRQNLQGEGKGLGDIWMGADYQILTETVSRPSVKGLFTLTLPTGKKNPEQLDDPEIIDIPVGYGYMAYEIGMAARKINYPYSWTAYINYRIKSEGSKALNPGDPEISFKDGNLLTLSGSFNFHMNEWLALVNDVYFFKKGDNREAGVTIENSSSTTFLYSPRLSFQIKRLRLNQTVQVPLAGNTTSADPGYILIVQYVF